MKKHQWRQRIKSFFDIHADPDKHEQMKRSRKDMEEKKEEMMRLIKAEHEDGKTVPLEELINDYHKQYESLYEEYHNLTKELTKKEKDSTSSSDSDSDSDDKDSSSKVSSKLEAANRDEIDNYRDRLAAVENENAELKSKLVELEASLRCAERSQSNEQLVIELQTTIEDLQRESEMDKEEVVGIEEKNRNLEVMLRLSNQKLRVTEQLLSEKEASHKKLEERNAALGRTVEEYGGMIRHISGQLSGSLAELERAITDKFNEDHGGLARSVVTLSDKIRSVRSWVAASRGEKVSNTPSHIDDDDDDDHMRKTIEKLEEEASKRKAEKEEVERALGEMEKAVREKDERLWSLEEEKREAIRQLCVWTEYYRSRCIELRGVLLKRDA